MAVLLERAAALAGARRAAGRKALDVLSGKLSALDPTAVLSRGYAIASHRRSGRVVRSAAEVAPGEPLDIRVSDGSFGAVAEGPDR